MSKFLVAYATLFALRENLENERYDVEEKYVQEFHKALTCVQFEVGKNSFDAGDFSIQDSEIKHHLTSSNYVTKQSTYSSARYCDIVLLKTKLDAALNYLKFIAPAEDKPKMGF